MLLDRWLTKKRTAVLIVAFVGGGGVYVAAAAASDTGGSQQLSPSAPAVTFPTNANGQTYGSAAGVAPSQQPDLIEADGSDAAGNDVTGYVRRSQLDAATGANVTSPQAAVAWTQAHAGESTTIPLYTQDGLTVIGTFTIAPSVPGQQPPTP